MDRHHYPAHIICITQKASGMHQDFPIHRGEASDFRFLVGSTQHVGNCTGGQVECRQSNRIQAHFNLAPVTADYPGNGRFILALYNIFHLGYNPA